MAIREQILERFRILRKRSGFSAKELSTKIGRQEDYISRVETGRFFPSVEDMEKVMQACNSSLEELFYGDFDSYKVDKQKLEKLKAINEAGNDSLVSLLTIFFQEKEIEKTKEKKEKTNEKTLRIHRK